MPVIVVGADTPLGEAAVAALLGRDGEVRAFVSDPVAAATLRERGVKVAVGDVSDASHIGGAALQAFSAVLVPECAFDARERAFADDAAAITEAWAEEISAAGVRRAIWVADERLPGGDEPFRERIAEVAVVDVQGRSPAAAAADIAALDDAGSL
jgi:nucleoside-diphosphate-sugar epimerase